MKLADMDRQRLSKQFQELRDLIDKQDRALEAGQRAEAEGRPVIYIHGRPYADPGHEKD